MAALPNIGGALCSAPQSLADAHYYSAVHAVTLSLAAQPALFRRAAINIYSHFAKAIIVEIIRGASNYRTDLSR